MRVVSLLPSATEILCALGLADSLRAVTHECDYPSVVLAKPRITRSRLEPGLASGAIDEAVRSQLESDAHSLYTIDRALLARIAPDLVVTQKLCEVCAVNYDEVIEAVSELPREPEVLNLEPMCLSDVFDDILHVGEAAGRPRAAEMLVRQLEARVELVRRTVARARTQPRVGFLEWLDPLFCGGHWNPELVELAGGIDSLGQRGQPSVRIEWEQVRAFAPEVLVISCCGFSAARASEDLPLLEEQPGWDELPAVQAGRVHIVDGAAYFSRPGPRVVESLEMLAEIVHPELFA